MIVVMGKISSLIQLFSRSVRNGSRSHDLLDFFNNNENFTSNCRGESELSESGGTGCRHAY